MDCTQISLLTAAVLHILFVSGEMLPWDSPFILKKVMAKKAVSFSEDQLKLVATIVHNAGIYNLILVAGFLWSAFPDAFGNLLEPNGVKAIRCFFLTGAVVAGVFGLTLSPMTVLQAIIGIVGLCFVWSA